MVNSTLFNRVNGKCQIRLREYVVAGNGDVLAGYGIYSGLLFEANAVMEKLRFLCYMWKS